MGCMPLDKPFKNGVEEDLRIARELEHAILQSGPYGLTYSMQNLLL